MTAPSAMLKSLLDFLQASPTPFHAVAGLLTLLQQHHFEILNEADPWTLQPGRSYIAVRNASSLVAFRLGTEDVVTTGVHVAGAHTDSPCLKVKPNPELLSHDCFQLGVEVYGGALLAPWFDRDLSLAGRVSFISQAGALQSALVDFKRPVATIPSLAIHLDREVNQNRSINPQTQLPAVLMLTSVTAIPTFAALLQDQISSEHGIDAKDILAYEICLYDTQPPALIGLSSDFIASARLDNLLSCFIAVQALLSAACPQTAMVVLNDHEEVGSASTAGAQGTLLQTVLRRLAGSYESYTRLVDKSLMISCDNAHAIHPNFADKHDAKHGPLINQGPVLKINANQRYATNSETAAYFRYLCNRVDAPVQSFVVRSDMACGSTIGPIVATETGIRTVDVGIPQWGMHSIRETAGSRDCEYLLRILQAFFRR